MSLDEPWCSRRCCRPAKENPDRCRFMVCDSVVTTRYRPRSRLGEEYRVCPSHEFQMKKAENKDFPIAESREGWLYVDNLIWLFFAT